MSIEIILYSKKATRNNLKNHLLKLGFRPCEHLWDWPDGSLHFSWFESNDFKSFDGVEATIFNRNKSEKLTTKDSGWALHTRTRISASIADRKFQNVVIKTAKKKFGGHFVNDWYGKNTYNPKEKDSQDAVARGMYLLYEHIAHLVKTVKYALPDSIVKTNKKDKIGSFIESNDPVIVMYNAVVPFAISIVESFFKQSFMILLRYDKNAWKKLEELPQKVEMRDVIALGKGEIAIENIVANRYSFQNITSIHNAFKKVDIDFYGLLKKRKKIGGKTFVLRKKLEEIINFRHELIHELSINYEFKREQIKEVFDFVLALINVFIDQVEERQRVKIRIMGKYL